MGDKRAGGEAAAMVGLGDDTGEGMQCSDHPYRTNPGGICAFCLQEKLGKLVSSSKSGSPFQAASAGRTGRSSSSSSPSFRSAAAAPEYGYGGDGFGRIGSSGSQIGRVGSGGGRAKIPFLYSSHHRKKKSGGNSSSSIASSGTRRLMTSSATSSSVSISTTTTTSSSSANSSGLVFKRSKSVAPRPLGVFAEGGGGDGAPDPAESPRRRRFWSFLYLSSSGGGGKRREGGGRGDHPTISLDFPAGSKEEAAKTPKRDYSAALAAAAGGAEEAESPNGSQASSSFGRKVGRSRSVGCGSRSFSGDFLERISTGFGDCTLRRVESQREAKPGKIVLHRVAAAEGDDPPPPPRVRCGGIFGGFGMISSSTSSSYWLPDEFTGSSGRMSTAGGGGGGPHGRSRSWNWAFASPMRAFRPSKPYTITVNREVPAASAASAAASDSSAAIAGTAHSPPVSDAGAASLLSVRG